MAKLIAGVALVIALFVASPLDELIVIHQVHKHA